MRFDISNKLNSIPKEALVLLNKSELARRLGCDPRTVDRHIKIQQGTLIPKERKKRKSVLDEYKDCILDKVDNHGATAMAVYKFIQKKGYHGKYSILADFVREHKQSEIKKATVRFETNPGLQAQIDWKEKITLVNRMGKSFQVNIFLAVLGYSRLKFLCLTQDRSQTTLFSCLIHMFQYFQGIPHELLFDNMKTVVDRSRSTFSRVELNESFRYFAADAGFRAITCRAYRPQTKGKVESLARLVDRLVVYNNEFDTFEDLEGIVNEFMNDINQEVSQATDEIPFVRYEKEKEYLKPLVPMAILSSYISHPKEYKVTKESMVTYKGRKYSVPTRYIGHRVTIHKNKEGSLSIYYNGDFITCHPQNEEKYNYKPEHLHEILRSDVCSHMSDEDVLTFMQDNLSMMDLFLGD
jgi:transposase